MIKTAQEKIDIIVSWIKKYATDNSLKCLVVGISGGVDSAVVSTLCAMTGIRTVVLGLPLHSKPGLTALSDAHGNWLCEKFRTVDHKKIDLTSTYDSFVFAAANPDAKLALANTKSRLRMVALYQVAAECGGIVVGTGNKVEDFGVGFFTKYGDGGVDISPIGDLMKSEVWEIARHLGVLQEIVDAPPTDGLWDDARTDESQLGMSYADLEWAMNYTTGIHTMEVLSDEKQRKLDVYRKLHEKNRHKFEPIPVCKING